VSLAFDGMTGGAQDIIRDEHHPPAHVMMVWMNVWSVLYLVICKSTTRALVLTSLICVTSDSDTLMFSGMKMFSVTTSYC